MKKGLIIRKEWLDKIFDEGKIWEMRTTKTKIRGKVALIQAKSGLIVGEVEITGCVEYEIPPTKFYTKFHKVEDLELIKKWKYAWILKDAKRYDKPIPFKSHKGAVIWVNLEDK